MKIEKTTNKTTFGQLDRGDVFISDGCTYLKVLGANGDEVGINLEENFLSSFDSYERIIFVPHAKLVM
jgi:hypothetical protein